MNETIKLGLILFLISAVAAGLLGFSNDITEGPIAEADRLANDEARQEVLPQAESFSSIDETKLKEIIESEPAILEIYEGYDTNSELVGHTFKALTSGYGGDIEFMIGISTEGKIGGFTILNHGETPGLGENATKSEFTDSFKDNSVESNFVSTEEPTADNEILALTGSTKTTDGILVGVNKVLEVFNSEFAN